MPAGLAGPFLSPGAPRKVNNDAAAPFNSGGGQAARYTRSGGHPVRDL